MLRYVVSEKGKEPDLDKIAVIDVLATPINANGIAKLLGHVGWYRKLILNFAKIAVPITQLLRKHRTNTKIALSISIFYSGLLLDVAYVIHLLGFVIYDCLCANV
jgi:hypothetical protein